VVGGTQQQVGYYAVLNPDCSFAGYATVRTQTQPAHGTIVVQEGQGYTSYTSDNQRYECNRQKSRMMLVYYTAVPGYTGTDSFVLHAIYPNGTPRTNRYNITVE
jgi:hypothetical protein